MSSLVLATLPFLSTHLHVLRVEFFPELGCSGSHVHFDILLWPALAGGLSVGVTVAPEFVCLWFLAFTTSPFPGKRTVKVNDRASRVPLRLLGRLPPPRLCCCDSSHLFRCARSGRVPCVDEAVLDLVRVPFHETSRPLPFVISSLLDAPCHRRHHLEHLVICLRTVSASDPSLCWPNPGILALHLPSLQHVRGCPR